jgi:polyferredoxin
LIIIFGIAPFNKYASFKGGGVKKSYQRKRYLILIGFQLVMFLIVPYFIAKSPAVFKLIYPWPLMYNSFINKSIIITVGALLLFTLVLPLFVLYHGKRFCSFVCTIGAVSQTCGNNLRHLAPKGKTAKKFEVISYGVLLFTAAATFIILFSGKGSAVSQITQSTYRFTVIFLLAAIVSVSLIPLFGAKVFCRFFCPLSRVMELLSKLFVKAKKSKFKIEVFDRCIKCGECSKHCEVAIDVMSYSKDALSFTDKEVSCTGCGVCISVCPVDNLAFPSMAGHLKGKKTLR